MCGTSGSLGTSQAPNNGTDVLLDLLSIGGPSPPQTSSSTPDIGSLSQDNKLAVGALEGLSLDSSLPAKATSPAGAPMMDLLDSLAPTAQTSVPTPAASGIVIQYFEFFFPADISHIQVW